MKQFWGLTLMILMIASNCFAMTFSQPVEIGVIGHMNLGGFTFKNVTENNGIEINDTRSRGHFKRFSQGVARFGNGQEALFFHYKNGTLEKKYEDEIMAFGGENIRNTVNVKIMTPKIHRIASDSERTFYFIEDGYDLPEDNIFTVIGKRKDGIWVKYFDSDSVAIKYFGKPNGVWQSNSLWFYEFNVQEDYIILKYAKYHKELRNQTTGFGAGYVKEGEFRFKWDDTAQWFGVEQVVY